MISRSFVTPETIRVSSRISCRIFTNQVDFKQYSRFELPLLWRSFLETGLLIGSWSGMLCVSHTIRLYGTILIRTYLHGTFKFIKYLIDRRCCGTDCIVPWSHYPVPSSPLPKHQKYHIKGNKKVENKDCRPTLKKDNNFPIRCPMIQWSGEDGTSCWAASILDQVVQIVGIISWFGKSIERWERRYKTTSTYKRIISKDLILSESVKPGEGRCDKRMMKEKQYVRYRDFSETVAREELNLKNMIKQRSGQLLTSYFRKLEFSNLMNCKLSILCISITEHHMDPTSQPLQQPSYKPILPSQHQTNVSKLQPFPFLRSSYHTQKSTSYLSYLISHHQKKTQPQTSQNEFAQICRYPPAQMKHPECPKPSLGTTTRASTNDRSFYCIQQAPRETSHISSHGRLGAAGFPVDPPPIEKDRKFFSRYTPRRILAWGQLLPQSSTHVQFRYQKKKRVAMIWIMEFDSVFPEVLSYLQPDTLMR